MLADWTSNFKLVLTVNILLTIVFNMATVFTPLSPLPVTSVSMVADLSTLSRLECVGDISSLTGNNWVRPNLLKLGNI